MRSVFEAGGTQKEAGPLGRRPGPGQKLDVRLARTQDQLQTQPGPIDPVGREGTKTPERKQS